MVNPRIERVSVCTALIIWESEHRVNNKYGFKKAHGLTNGWSRADLFNMRVTYT